MTQEIAVGLIVAVAAIVVLRRYAPQALKRAARIVAVRLARALGWRALAERLARPAETGASCGDGCGTCGNCGTKAAPGHSTTIPVEELKKTLRR